MLRRNACSLVQQGCMYGSVCQIFLKVFGSSFGDSIKLESFDKSRRVKDEASTKVVDQVEWWARNELLNEKVEEVEEQEMEVAKVITIEDLQEIWDHQVSLQSCTSCGTY